MHGAYRPLIHFTPEKGWMNDPNGMVYHGGEYHLCYQHYPHSKEWGPMHWGHAVSRDLLHWQHLDIALAPCEQGMIFSGSAMVDARGVAGTPGGIVAIYTLHGDKERQGVAFSADGRTFVPYGGNPVIDNPGIADFRDPKFFQVPGEECIRMVLAAGDRAHFYQSDDFVHWEKTGEFGPDGNHLSGVWECPDIFPLRDEQGNTHWALLVSMTPNINQYFIGDFVNGAFCLTQRLDHPQYLTPGGDTYAAVTFADTPGEERILMAWMNDWRYANLIPTHPHRGAMTLPRVLGIQQIDGVYVLTQQFHDSLTNAAADTRMLEEEQPVDGTFLVEVYGEEAFTLMLSNDQGEQLLFGVDGQNRIFIDRTRAGISNFYDGFAQRFETPRLAEGPCRMSVVYDVAGIELCADDGTLSYSVQVFPQAPYTLLSVADAEGTLSVLK
ncbi:MAG: glycoside hydrolase family 32 protein [Eubacteriales bacterium]|nr:glycoside hydrolase family 32 protein [Eubacteriales bacterium]